MTWTITGYRPSEKGYQYLPTREFATKREAVSAMMSEREPKTAVLKVGHAYTYQARKAQ